MATLRFQPRIPSTRARRRNLVGENGWGNGKDDAKQRENDAVLVRNARFLVENGSKTNHVSHSLTVLFGSLFPEIVGWLLFGVKKAGYPFGFFILEAPLPNGFVWKNHLFGPLPGVQAQSGDRTTVWMTHSQRRFSALSTRIF